MVVLPEAHPLCAKEKIENLENEPFMLSEHGGKTEVTELLEKVVFIRRNNFVK